MFWLILKAKIIIYWSEEIIELLLTSFQSPSIFTVSESNSKPVILTLGLFSFISRYIYHAHLFAPVLGKLLHVKKAYTLVSSALHVSLYSISEEGIHFHEKCPGLMGFLLCVNVCISPVQKAVCGSASQITSIFLWHSTWLEGRGTING